MSSARRPLAATGTASRRGLARQPWSERGDAEALLWACLRARRTGRLLFRRRDVVGGVVVAFACRERRLAIDVTDANPLGDMALNARRARLRAAGYALLSVRGADVTVNPAAVCERIRRLCATREPARLENATGDRE